MYRFHDLLLVWLIGVDFQTLGKRETEIMASMRYESNYHIMVIWLAGGHNVYNLNKSMFFTI